MRRICLLLIFLLQGLLVVLPSASHASYSGYRITDAQGQQSNIMLTSDGKKSAVCVWTDDRTGSPLLYAQRFDSLGVKHWAADGIPIATIGTNVSVRHLLADSLDGAWLVYTSMLGSVQSLRVQHVDSTGLCTATLAAPLASSRAGVPGDIGLSAAVITRAGILTCLRSTTYPNGTSNYSLINISAHLADGSMAWEGVPAASRPSTPVYSLALLADEIGGCFVAVNLNDGYGPNAIRLNLQHYDANGIRQWERPGLPAVQAQVSQSMRLLRRSAGSAYIAFSDGYPEGNNLYFNVVSVDSALRWPDASPLLATASTGIRAIASHDNNEITVLAPITGSPEIRRYREDGSTLSTSRASLVGGLLIDYVGVAANEHFTCIFSRGVLQAYSQYGLPLFPIGGLPITLMTLMNTDNIAMLGNRTLMAWADKSMLDNDAFAQMVTIDGSRTWPESDAPQIVSVKDVRNDQGGHVSVTWQGTRLDTPTATTISAYRVWRRVSASRVAGLSGIDSPRDRFRTLTRAGAQGSAVEYWEAIAEVPAAQLKGYAAVVPTTQDSLPGDNPYTAFFVSALTDYRTIFYDSVVDSGYSVDNLPPHAPLFAGARYDAGRNHLHWLPNTEADLNGYILYRGPHPDFVIDVTDPVAFVADTGYVDAASGPMYYKIAAVDRHGNRSPYITVLPTGNAGVGGGLSLAFSLGRPFPNPSDGSSLNVEFTLPTAAPALLEVLDVSGRCVLRDDLAGHAAGRYTLDLAKRTRLAAGLYLVKLQQSGMTRTIRTTVLN